MVISGVLFFNTSAELVISRFYKSDYNHRVAAEAFRVKVVSAKKYDLPVIELDHSSFLFIKHDDLVIAAITRKNANATMVFQFLYSLIELFKAYFDGDFSEQAIRSNFLLVYELLDEVMDHGYPQIMAIDLLKQFIHHGSARELQKKGKKSKSETALEEQRNTREITATITGACSWRQEGKYNYAKNEVYLDVVENVNVIVNQQGKVLSSYCNGKIMMKSSLSGMPICRFGLNDKVAMQRRRDARGSKKKVSSKSGIDLQDVTFHKCVRLNKYDEDKTIMFTPPDGEYELMTYRINKCSLPFEVNAVVDEKGRNRVEYMVKIKAKYEKYNVAQDITVRVPVPAHTASVNVKSTNGKCQYMPTKSWIAWKLPKLAGGDHATVKGDVKLTHLIQDKVWQKPPISLQFTIPMWPASGIKVRFLNVQEPKLNYKSIKWVRYITHAGDYQIRI